MANQRNVKTYYGTVARVTLHENCYHARGSSVSTQGAVLAATRRVTSGEFNRCDVYDMFGHVCTISRDRSVVTIQYHTRRR